MTKRDQKVLDGILVEYPLKEVLDEVVRYCKGRMQEIIVDTQDDDDEDAVRYANMAVLIEALLPKTRGL